MKEIILNEKEYAEKLIADYSLGKDEFVSIGILAKYWRSQGLNAPKIRRCIEDHILRSKPYAKMFRYREMIDKAVNASKKWPLVQLDYIGVTKKEIEAISTLGSMPAQQLMFAMLCLAKYRHLVNERNSGWINTPCADVYRLANVFGTLDKKASLQRDLQCAGMIEWARRADSDNICVLICDYDNEPVLEVSDFRNLGYQYRQFNGEPYFACSECGIVVRKNSNRMMYCHDCAEEINRKKARDRWFQLA